MEFQRHTDQQLNLSNLSGVETVEDVEDVEVPERPRRHCDVADDFQQSVKLR